MAANGQLVHAAADGDVGGMRAALADGADPDCWHRKSVDGMYINGALEAAVASGSTTAVLYLLDIGADPSGPDHVMNWPLYAACVLWPNREIAGLIESRRRGALNRLMAHEKAILQALEAWGLR